MRSTFNPFHVKTNTLSFKNGIAFCELVNSFAADTIPYKKISLKGSGKKNIPLAFTAAERVFGVPLQSVS